MKRLIPAGIILIFLIAICVFSHTYTDKICEQAIKDVENYYNKNISADTLQDTWNEHKEKMSVFVNHEFLDEMSIYVGQLSAFENKQDSPETALIYKNIETFLSLIKEEQKFAIHSFY